MFRFNFQQEDDEDGDINMTVDSHLVTSDTRMESPGLDHAPAKYIQPASDPIVIRGTLLNVTPNTCLYQSDPSDLRNEIKEKSSWMKQVLDKADVVSGQYEGGFKTWQGSLDLIQALETMHEDMWWFGKSVFELGCGQGLPGMYCLQRGSFVTFQDYNEEVLSLLTIPNTLLNQTWPSIKSDTITLAASPSSVHKVSFISGDWKLVQDLLNQQSSKYDVILTAETVYNADSHIRLYEIMKSVLAQNGIIYIAAKSTYFGCTGDLDGFRRLVEQDGVMNYQTVFVVSETVRREVVKLTFRNQ